MLDAAGVVARVREHIDRVPDFSGVVVAFSGGLDSSVLLHVLASGGVAPLRAVYVDHDLQQDISVSWQAHNAAFCQQLRVPLTCQSVQVDTSGGVSVEAAARDARYVALGADVRRGELLVVAQHEADQAESLLLQLLRGAGPEGLAAMPQVSALGDTVMLRPLLDCPVDAIAEYAQGHALRWFDDPSNAQQRFDRNYLRHSVLPVLRQRWPALDQTLARSARWQAEAAGLQQQLAAQDMRAIRTADGTALDCDAVLQLPETRRRNVLRFAIRCGGLALPSASRLAALVSLVAAPTGRGSVRWPGGIALRYRQSVYLLHELAPEPLAGWQAPLAQATPCPLPHALGTLHLEVAQAQGLALQVRFREGGERVALPDGGHQSIAKWFQSRGIPPWQRSRMPLVFAGDELVAVGEHLLPAWPLQRVRGALRWVKEIV